ncbi:hypothetical protein EHQ12_16450 [Leptospira gomenensis]|uniref:Uncharacterized protein n=1 Tax=Leptospira gomenensis TaxID=2484974 RepID=A0A5F1YT62_9LEPT|nr:hypothetical protein [Leptospira gomenensis]TGK31784.1 hypothetical protein EHQ17_13475 [Leptospira gomenensis]TGK34805.1 hypothetical protein EHQ12_16450 [Leptospira gomenensis]TGK41588.1 hypothetical protein EHQ07_16000 [Leptospira gomenensis]TGK61452.1 hypothetical protein EHQ13_08865 [Leptospira gomenensis]
MKTSDKRIRYVLAAGFLAIVFNVINCSENKKEDLLPLALVFALTGSNTLADLPQPVDGTATVRLGEDNLVFTKQFECESGNINNPDPNNGLIGGFITVGTPDPNDPNGFPIVPMLMIHNIDFSIDTQTLGDNGVAVNVDMAQGSYGIGTNFTPGNCVGTVKENSATVFDLQAIDCPATRQTPQSTLPDTTFSFRVRCTK